MPDFVTHINKEALSFSWGIYTDKEELVVFYVKRDYGGSYDVVDTADGVVENISRDTLIQLVKRGIKIYGVSNGFRVKTFKSEHDILNQYRLQCDLAGVDYPLVDYTADGFFLDEYTGTASRFRVPEFVDMICREAFSRRYQLEEVYIPDSVRLIAERAFSDCTSLSKVRLPDGLGNLPALCFYETRNLRGITLPNSIETLGSRAFMNSGLREIEVSNTLTFIGRKCFYGTPLKSFVAPASLQYINDSAFHACGDLRRVELPEGLCAIGDLAFKDCTSLEYINIPDSVEGLGVDSLLNVPKEAIHYNTSSQKMREMISIAMGE